MPNIKEIATPTIEGKVVEIIESIQAATKVAGDFALSQLPDLAQSYIMYGRAKSAGMAIFFLIIIAFCIKGIVWATKLNWKRDPEQIVGTICVLGLIAAVPMLIFFFDYLVWFAPKIWLLKELASFLK